MSSDPRTHRLSSSNLLFRHSYTRDGNRINTEDALGPRFVKVVNPQVLIQRSEHIASVETIDPGIRASGVDHEVE